MTVAALRKLAALPPNNKGVDMIRLSLPALGQAK